MKKNSSFSTVKLVTVALLIAAEIILTRFLSINTPLLRISFGFVPVVLVAIMYGPLWSGTAYAIGDIIGGILFPVGAFFPGYTLSAFLTGVIYGIFLHKDRITTKDILLSSFLVMFIVNLGLGTLWLTILTGKAFMVLLPARLIKELVMYPVTAALIKVLDGTVIRYARRNVQA